MHWIAPSEKDADNAALEKRLWDTVDTATRVSANPECEATWRDFRGAKDHWSANSGLIFLRFASGRASPLALVMSLALFLCGGCATPSPVVPAVAYNMHELGVVTDVLPLVVQPEQVKWRQLQVGMTEGEVTALLGNPYRKDARPTPDTKSNVIHLYAWYYGEISFQSYTTKGAYYYRVTFHEGRVSEISDPWQGKFSPDGQPTVPELVLPQAGQTLDHYPRFMDFRWQPASGIYPIEYEVAIQVLEVNQQEAEHFEDYVRKTIDRNRANWKEAGTSEKEMDKTADWVARDLRQKQGAQATYSFRTHDIYLPFTWVGANTGRWRIRATNAKGTSEWTAWRYFSFST